MNTLFIENDVDFTAEMLLGAMIDMGASVCYIENMLLSSGIEAKIYHDTVIRDGMEAEFAYVKSENVSRNIVIDEEIKRLVSDEFDFKGKTNDEITLSLAVLYAINCFSPDLVVSLGCLGKNEIDKQLIKSISNEQQGFAFGDIVCVGYGAGEEKILRAVIYSHGSGIELKKEEKSLTFQI